MQQSERDRAETASRCHGLNGRLTKMKCVKRTFEWSQSGTAGPILSWTSFAFQSQLGRSGGQ